MIDWKALWPVSCSALLGGTLFDSSDPVREAEVLGELEGSSSSGLSHIRVRALSSVFGDLG